MAFTGSLRAGQEIGRIAAQRILPLTLELGGKSPNIVFADADFDAAIAGVLKGLLTHAGQVCLAGTRVLVERSIHDRFVEALAAAVTRQPVGTDDSVVGPMTTHAQFEKVQSYYEVARNEGAVAVAGGNLPSDERLRKGWFVSPTLYTNVTTDMRIYREEIFGRWLSSCRSKMRRRPSPSRTIRSSVSRRASGRATWLVPTAWRRRWKRADLRERVHGRWRGDAARRVQAQWLRPRASSGVAAPLHATQVRYGQALARGQRLRAAR